MAVNGAEVAAFVSPFVPDADAAFVQPREVGVSTEEPQQFAKYGAGVNLLRGDEWEPLREVEPKLPPKHRACAGAGAVVFDGTIVFDVGEKIQVALHVSSLGDAQR